MSRAPAHGLVGRSVTFSQTMVADIVDMLPAIAATWIFSQVEASRGAPAWGFGFLVWLGSVVLCRALTGTSLGGVFRDVQWVQRNGRPAGIGANFGYALYGQTYAVIAMLVYVAFFALMPWKLLRPSTWQIFVVPNTPLFGLIADRRSRPTTGRR